MFIGRKEELDFLEAAYASQKAELVVLYGRRRIGKTETLHAFCKEKPHSFYTCTEYTDLQQLRAFSSRILTQQHPAAAYVDAFADWERAFSAITQLPGTEKKLLIIDEFPYMVKNNHGIPSMLQKLWDQQLKEENVMIVLCGSAMAFIEKEILAEKNPLYGRATGILKMKELDFYEAIQFFPHFSPESQMAAYGILGGIPHYLKQFDDRLTLEENILKHIFTRGSILYNEIEFLLRQELRETTVYNTIIEAIALGNTGLNGIHQKTQIDKSKLSVYLKNLLDLHIIYREFPTVSSPKDQANVQRGLYQLSDHYFRFWYAFVFPYLSELEAGSGHQIYQQVVAPSLNDFVSKSFEKACLSHLRHLNKSNRLPFTFVRAGRWWHKDQEIDLLAFDLNRQHWLLGECKYRNQPMTLSNFLQLQQKGSTATAGKAVSPENVYYYLFSKNGFSEDLIRMSQNTPHLHLTDLPQLLNHSPAP